MSTPALKPLPSARSTTTCTPGSPPALLIAAARSNQPCTVNAFTGGKSTVTTSMCSSTRLLDTGISSLLCFSLHELLSIYGLGLRRIGQQLRDHRPQLGRLPPGVLVDRGTVPPGLGHRHLAALDLENPARHTLGFLAAQPDDQR